MEDYDVRAIDVQYTYTGNITPDFMAKALDAYRTYKADKYELVERIKDNENYYRRMYTRTQNILNRQMHCETPFIFSAIENGRSDAVENYPVANVLEREKEGTETALKLSKILPKQLDMSDFKRVYKKNMRNKLKYGTAIYGVFYGANSDNIIIRDVDIQDIFCDMHLEDVQDSQFLFVAAAIDNETLKMKYPECADLFCGDTTVDSLEQDFVLKDRSTVLDCYYKKPGGTLHMMKLCKNTIIAATEDDEGFENGIYDHGKYPVVFDTLYPQHHCPFGFGMIDIAKGIQIEIDKLDKAITENVIANAKPRYLCKKNGGINEQEFADFSKNVVHYEGDPSQLQAISGVQINANTLSHRAAKIDELKEITANRDFQQGATSGGVTAASAIETLTQQGEKRSRGIIDDTYDAFKDICYMVLELMRQFYDTPHPYRVEDEHHVAVFEDFVNTDMYKLIGQSDGMGGINPMYKPLIFDVDIVPQRKNPITRESQNNTMLTLWNYGLMNPELYDQATVLLRNMSFDGAERFLADLTTLHSKYIEEQQQLMAQQQAMQQQTIAQQQSTTQSQEDLIPIDITTGNITQAAQGPETSTVEELIPVAIGG